MHRLRWQADTALKAHPYTDSQTHIIRAVPNSRSKSEKITAYIFKNQKIHGKFTAPGPVRFRSKFRHSYINLMAPRCFWPVQSWSQARARWKMEKKNSKKVDDLFFAYSPFLGLNRAISRFSLRKVRKVGSSKS